MHLLLIDKKEDLVSEWNRLFERETNVTVMLGDLTEVSCDAIVSPANSFGFMDGGIDYAISNRFGWELQEVLQQRIKKSDLGELLVGQSMVLETGDDIIPYLISSPTMRVPSSYKISSSINAYLATKSSLIAASKKDDIEYLAIPGMCTGVGRMPVSIAANQMYQAYNEIINKSKMNFSDWNEAQKYHLRINPLGKLYQ